MIELRDYQSKAIDDIRNAFRQGFKAPFLTAPTGAGKTVVLSKIAQDASAKETLTVLLVHRQELVVQTSKTFAKFRILHTIVAPSSVVHNAIKIQNEEFVVLFFVMRHTSTSRPFRRSSGEWPIFRRSN